MLRWLVSFALASMAACGPSPPDGAALPLCSAENISCPACLDSSWFWREPPATLAPDEAVVEVVNRGGYVAAVRRASSELDSAGVERACTSVNLTALHKFQVTRVVAGAFNEPEFLLDVGAGCCNNGVSTIGLGNLLPPADGKPAYLVIRPSIDPPPREQVWTRPVMVARSEHRSHR